MNKIEKMSMKERVAKAKIALEKMRTALIEDRALSAKDMAVIIDERYTDKKHRTDCKIGGQLIGVVNSLINIKTVVRKDEILSLISVVVEKKKGIPADGFQYPFNHLLKSGKVWGDRTEVEKKITAQEIRENLKKNIDKYDSIISSIQVQEYKHMF